MAQNGHGIPRFIANRPLFFHEQMSDTIMSFLGDSLLCDLVLKGSKDSTVLCHRLILAAASPYIQEQLLGASVKRPIRKHKVLDRTATGLPSATQADHRVIIRLGNVQKKAIEAIVHYCYRGEIDIQFELVKDCIYLIELLKLDDTFLQDLLKYVMINTSAANCVSIFLFSHRFRQREVLRTFAETEIANNFQDVVQGEEFLGLSVHDLCTVMRHGMSFMTSCNHDIRLRACLRWIVHDIEERKKHFTDILHTIDLSKCSARFMMYISKNCSRSLSLTKDTLAKLNNAIQKQKPIVKRKPNLKNLDPAEDDSLSVVYVVGGISDNKRNTKCWQIDIRNEKATNITSLPPKANKYNSAVCAVEGIGFVVIGGGGCVTTSQPSSQCFLYNSADDLWTETEPLSSPVECASAVAIDQNVHVLGGLEERGDIMESLDLGAMTPTSPTTCLLPPFEKLHQKQQQPCAQPSTSTLGPHLHHYFQKQQQQQQQPSGASTLGRQQPQQPQQARHRHTHHHLQKQQQQQSWCLRPRMLEKCASPIVAVLHRIIYVLFNTAYVNTKDRVDKDGTHHPIRLARYQPLLHAWSRACTLPDGISGTEGSTLTPCRDKLILMGGDDGFCMALTPDHQHAGAQDSNVVCTILKTPPSPDLVCDRWKAATISMSGKILILGGKKSYVTSDVIAVYYPETNSWDTLRVKLPVPLWKHSCFKLS